MSVMQITLWKIRETEKACHFSSTPFPFSPANVWLPKSQIKIVLEKKTESEWLECVVELPKWLADEKDLPQVQLCQNVKE
jgi:hypothetical protein